MKIYDAGNNLYFFYCPGCRSSHGFSTEPGRWTFNDDFIQPTVSPSILCNGHDLKTRCHSFIENGNIRFLADCHHNLRNLIIAIPDWNSF